MAEKRRKKKVNNLSLKECEEIIKKMGGMVECAYVQHVMQRYNVMQAKNTFDKKN
jgi:enoyl-[acyl-carrier-protein] reductase (NADH)